MSGEKKEELSEEESRLFREHVAKHPPPPPRRESRTDDTGRPRAAPPARPGRRRKGKPAAPRPSGVVYCRAGFQETRLRRLRCGPYQVDAEIDLHGDPAVAAMERLKDFLQQCINAGQRQVRVIHGRGLRSRDGHPVLKDETERWLREQTRSARLLDPTSWRGRPRRAESLPARSLIRGYYSCSCSKTTACTAMPSPRPMAPMPSVVVALMLMRSASIPRLPARAVRMALTCGASLGACAQDGDVRIGYGQTAFF